MRRFALFVAVVALVGAIVLVPHPPGGGPPLRDFEAYYAAGDTWTYRGDPYSRDIWRTEKDIPGIVASRDELLPFVGPPFGLPLWSAFARLPWERASLVWAGVVGLAFATIVLGSLALGRGRLGWFESVAALVFAAAFAPLTGGVELGQVAIVASAAVVVLPWTLRPRGILGAATLACIAALQPNIAIVLAARLAAARTWIAFGAAALVVTGTSALALGGPTELPHYVAVLRAHAAAERFIAIQTTPGAVARALGASAAVADWVALALTLGCIAAILFVSVRKRHAPTVRLALACALVPLAVPFAHEHDFTIAFLPAMLLLVRTSGAGWACGATAAVVLGVDWLALAQRPTGIGSTLALAVTAGCATLALAPGRLRPYHALPLAVVPCVALVAAVAAGHPLPTWPQGLPSDFHAATHATAAEVWRDEQARTGIAALDPVWGALRAIPLIACAAIWFAANRALTAERALRTDAR